MIVNINQNGILIIRPENGFEFYALSKWASDNVFDKSFKTEHFIVDLSKEFTNEDLKITTL